MITKCKIGKEFLMRDNSMYEIITKLQRGKFMKETLILK